MINIPELSYNDIVIPAGSYSYNNMLMIIGAKQIEQDGYKYIVLPEPLDENSTLNTCYYFHNLEVGQSSCLDAMYEVCNNTSINLVNFTGVYDLTSITPFEISYCIIPANESGQIQQIAPVLSNTAATMNDYYNLFNLGGTITTSNNTNYITVPNNICAFIEDADNEWNPARMFISNNIANNPILTNIPSQFYYGQPLKVLDQFSTTNQINIPNGIYTLSSFKELLPTILPEGYSYTNGVISVSNPSYTFSLNTPLFNIGDSGYTMSYKLQDPLETYRGVNYLSNNRHMAVFPESSNPSFLLNFADGGPRFVECPITNFPVYFSINTSNFYEVMKQELYSNYDNINLDTIQIPVNENYTKVKLTGYLSNADITIPKTVEINGTSYICNTNLDIQSEFTLPLTCSGDVTFTGKAYLKNDY